MSGGGPAGTTGGKTVRCAQYHSNVVNGSHAMCPPAGTASTTVPGFPPRQISSNDTLWVGDAPPPPAHTPAAAAPLAVPGCEALRSVPSKRDSPSPAGAGRHSPLQLHPSGHRLPSCARHLPGPGAAQGVCRRARKHQLPCGEAPPPPPPLASCWAPSPPPARLPPDLVRRLPLGRPATGAASRLQPRPPARPRSLPPAVLQPGRRVLPAVPHHQVGLLRGALPSLARPLPGPGAPPALQLHVGGGGGWGCSEQGRAGKAGQGRAGQGRAGQG